MGYDPAKPGPTSKEKVNVRVDLPPEAYLKTPIDNRFTKRPGYNTDSRPIAVHVNQFSVKSIDPDQRIYQYDIAISPIPRIEKALLKKCWNHASVRDALRESQAHWLYDGNKLAWSTALIGNGELRLTIDLDSDREVNRGSNIVYFMMKKTTQIDMRALKSYLSGISAWDNTVLECMNFLDHLIRQRPSENLFAIKRNFYDLNEPRRPLTNGTFNEVATGAYASIRLCQIKSGGTGLGINVDVANTAMWTGGQSLLALMQAYLPTIERRFSNLSKPEQARALSPVADSNGVYRPSQVFQYLRRFHKLKFTMMHRERGVQPGSTREHTVFRVVFDPAYGSEGATARNVTFEADGRRISVRDYFYQRYNITLRWPDLPVIETTKKGCYMPMELCWIKPMQRFPFKLSGAQTSDMIRIAVTRPPVRRANIMQKFASLDYQNDHYLHQYGVRIDNHFTATDARLLKSPVLQFNRSKIEPGTNGRWDLKGKKLFVSNTRPLKTWGFVRFTNVVDFPLMTSFARQFKQFFIQHGGVVSDDPLYFDATRGGDLAAALKSAHDQWQQKKRSKVDLMFCIISKGKEDIYIRLKKSADCRLAVLTQMLLDENVVKSSPQYCSNVCLKVNAKLGGATSRIFGPRPHSPFYNIPTMVLGVDVSHASPGTDSPSMASMVMSVDQNACRYAAAVETNGYKVEMLTRANINKFLDRLLPAFRRGTTTHQPQHVYYFRDGVSEGQFAQVIEYEVNEMKERLRVDGVVPKFTVIVATKRHHIRFFPDRTCADKNGNPLPGTLVERDVTHPFHWDFYLCSHLAIQGTARPVHYHVILDEANCQPNELQRMIYEQCYMYARSTTAVSLHPAVYYAHLASSRARAHDPGPQGGSDDAGPGSRGLAGSGDVRESAPLRQMGAEEDAHRDNIAFFPGTMWYI